MEEFKTIKGYENYSISNIGNVKNNKTNRILKPYFQDEYKRITLNDNKHFKVHRLVALAFIPNPNNKSDVDHINNNRSDNRVENLRWSSHKENSQNRSTNKNNTSGVKRINKEGKRWRASIGYNNKLIHIGSYKTKEEAIEARQKKAKELFGEFMNECEKPQIIEINLNIKKKKNFIVKLNINIEDDTDEEYKRLEKEFEELVNSNS